MTSRHLLGLALDVNLLRLWGSYPLVIERSCGKSPCLWVSHQSIGRFP